MAREVAWLRAALADLDEIGEYISRDSASYAKITVTKLHDAAMELADFPLMGRRVPEWDDDRYRERGVYSYRLIYRVVSEDRVEILGVIHGARLLPASLRRRT
jgi:plasmid stabilization system protein ParE